jgi:hypothetical protein
MKCLTDVGSYGWVHALLAASVWVMCSGPGHGIRKKPSKDISIIHLWLAEAEPSRHVRHEAGLRPEIPAPSKPSTTSFRAAHF